MIEIRLHDRGAQLWREARERADGAGAGLVVAGRMAAHEQARDFGSTIFGDVGLLSVSGLFAATEAALPPAERPPTASDRLVRLAALDRLLADPDVDLCEELRRCRSPADREVLLGWIDRVAARADREHREAARTAVEIGVERLRAALDERELVSEARRRAQIARRAELARITRRLVIGPSPLADPFVSGLLKGLARRQEIYVYGLTSEALADPWLREARLGPAWGTPAPALALGRDDVVGALYAGRSGRGAVRLLEAGDELGEALAHIRALIDQGVSADAITLALARPERDLLRVEQIARRAGVPLLARRAVGAADTPLGLLALTAARAGVKGAELAALGRAAGLEESDARALAEVSGIDRARLLHQALGPLAERDAAPPELAAREMNWLDALAGELLVAESIAPPPSCAEIVAGARTRSLLLGEPGGVAVVGYAEAQGLARGHLVATGLSDGEWPPRERPSPFISPETLAGCPGLAPPDRRVDFAGALCAHETALLVREARDGAGRHRAPSVLYAAARSAGAEVIAPAAPGPRSPLLGSPARSVREELRELARDKTRFTISELSLYLGCPRAWEVTHGLGLAQRKDAAMRRGEVAHRMLEAAFAEPDLPVEARIERAGSALETDEEAPQIDPPGRAVLAAQVARVITEYSSPAWPFTPVAVEIALELQWDPLGATIAGRTDRIDEMPGGLLLLIDYKLGRRAHWRGAPALGRDLQACLYPAMVAHRLQREVFGAIFVSVRHEGYDGLVRRLAPGLAEPTLHRDADLLFGLARRNLTLAVEGIRAGRFDGEAPGCWARCPCQALRLRAPAA